MLAVCDYVVYNNALKIKIYITWDKIYLEFCLNKKNNSQLLYTSLFHPPWGLANIHTKAHGQTHANECTHTHTHTNTNTKTKTKRRKKIKK